MKLLKWIGLGIGIWAVGLVWPEINFGLSVSVIIGLIGLSGLLALLEQRLDQNELQSTPANRRPAETNAPTRPAQSTRPMLGEVIRHNTASRPTRPVAI